VGSGFFGIILVLLLAWLLSENRKKINLRIVGSAFLLQAALATFAMYVPLGKDVLAVMSSGVQNVIDYSGYGIEFLFGDLATNKYGFLVFVRVLPVIIFISALVSVLYYLHIMQWVVMFVGGIMRKLIGTSRVESLCAAANIFLGHTESPLVVRPYLNQLSEAQLFTIMVSGMASISGAILAGYASLGVQLDYLIAASFMAAPGGLLMAKIMKPDDLTRPEPVIDIMAVEDEGRPANVIDAAASGAAAGLKIAAIIGAMLVAFVALIAMLNGMVGGLASLAGFEGITMDLILGKLLSPVMYLLGIPWQDAAAAGNLVGQKFILNEFVAYAQLQQIKDSLDPHTVIVSTFALCGFANLSSIAILLGGLGAMAPTRKAEIARMGFKAVVAGFLSNMMSAALVSLLLSL
tara:strand:- start:326 stop:1543 length:1218 start_codon:yes stop_codon:yes gene_type:complete